MTKYILCIVRQEEKKRNKRTMFLFSFHLRITEMIITTTTTKTKQTMVSSRIFACFLNMSIYAYVCNKENERYVIVRNSQRKRNDA